MGSPTSILLELALLLLDEIKGPLFPVLQLVRGKDSPPALMNPGSASPPISGIDGQKVDGRASFLQPCYHMSDE